MNSQRWMSQNFFIFFITWGVFLPYWTGWLVQAKGLSVTEASLIMGFGLLARGASTMFAFPLASKYWSNQLVILILTICSLVATILYVPVSSFVSLFIITMIFSAVYPTLLPAMDSTAGSLVQQAHIHYGKSRSYGSLGFIISVFINSLIIGYFGDQAILWCMMVGLFLILFMRFLPAPAVLLVKPKVTAQKESRSMRDLWKVRSFPIVLLVAVLIQGAHASYYNYGYIYLQDIGVNSYYIGIIINIAVIFEIIYFVKADHLLMKWQPSSLLLLAAAGSTVRWLLVFFFQNVWIFAVSQSLHALSFGVAHYAFIRYVTNTLPKEQIANAQGIYSATALSLGTAVLTLMGGMLYELSPGLAFLGMIVCTFPAMLLIIMTRKHYNY